tara:strand:+ start:280 stop:510 length:231 start_codon:yes stop_codon:yes gene_type:complete
MFDRVRYVEELTIEQRNELNWRIAEGIKNKDAFTSDADVRYFETEDFLEEVNLERDFEARGQLIEYRQYKNSIGEM